MITTILLVSFVNSSECASEVCGLSTSTVVTNDPPSVPNCWTISAITLNAQSTKVVSVYCNVTDTGSYTDINVTSATGQFTKSGETTRSSGAGGCWNSAASGTTMKVGCNVTFQYYDGSGSWSYNITIQDNSQGQATNTSYTATVNALDYVDVSATSISWSSVSPNTNDNEATTAITWTNGGNQPYATLGVTAYNATSSGNTIHADKFMIDDQTGQTTGQTYLDDSVSIDWVPFSLPDGSSSTEVGYFYVDIGNLPPGTYTSTTNWLFAITT